MPERAYKHDKDGLLRCRVCNCTDREACNPACSWARGDVRGDLCSTCALMVQRLQEYFESAHRPSWAALKREVAG